MTLPSLLPALCTFAIILSCRLLQIYCVGRRIPHSDICIGSGVCRLAFSQKHTVDRMEYATGIILAQTVVVCIISTIAIMWCFFEEEPRKVKTD